MNSNIKTNLITITYGLGLLYLVFYHKEVFGLLGEVLSVTTPFIYGCVMAYLLNGPFKMFYCKCFGPSGLGKNKFIAKGRKPLSLMCTYLSVGAAIFVLISMVLPQIIQSVNILIEQIPTQYVLLRQSVLDVVNDLEIDNTIWVQIEAVWGDILKQIGAFLYSIVPSTIGFITTVGSSMTNIFFGFIISVYLLSGKDKLKKQAFMVMEAFMKDSTRERVLNIASLTHKTFSGFITGQLTEAFILGVLCFIGMSLFGFPYAMLCSVVIGVTNVIPVVGPILGSIPATFIVLMANISNPITAVWFVVFILIVQRLDNDIIYPRVVGNSIGLSGLWVILAILVGANLFGFVGLILGVPMTAVAYALLRDATYKRLE